MKQAQRIYLDHAATTPVLPEVAEAMKPWIGSAFGNPSSLHAEGRKAREAIDAARAALSERLGCSFGEVIFTSSGTEAANLAIVGAALANRDSSRNRILFGSTEHHCVLNTRPVLERLGYRVELLPTDREGLTDLVAFDASMGEDVLLVSVMHANNELGTIQPIHDIAALAKRSGALLHCDTVQTFGALEWNVPALGAHLITVSAHKINGPKGAGALYIKAGTKITPLINGGGQEREMRAGTENTAAIVGFAAAIKEHRPSDPRIRQVFVEALQSVPGFRQTVVHAPVLPGHAHVRFEGAPAEAMLIALDRLGVSASSGAACSSGSLEPSHVLLACGYPEAEAKEGLRFTFGYGNTAEEAVEAASRVATAVEQVRRF